MRIGFISRGTLRKFKEECNRLCDDAYADLLLFGFDGVGEVSYEKELKGESDFFADVAILSKLQKNVVISGCVTDTRGIKRKSAVVAEKGKLLGVSDMLHALDGKIGCGAALKIYDTAQGKIGVVVAEDFLFAEGLESLSRCGCDFIVCPFGRLTDSLQSVLIRAYAFRCGLPILLCGQGYAMVAAPTGELIFASPQSPTFFKFEKRQEYHLIETRRRLCLP